MRQVRTVSPTQLRATASRRNPRFEASNMHASSSPASLRSRYGDSHSSVALALRPRGLKSYYCQPEVQGQLKARKAHHSPAPPLCQHHRQQRPLPSALPAQKCEIAPFLLPEISSPDSLAQEEACKTHTGIRWLVWSFTGIIERSGPVRAVLTRA